MSIKAAVSRISIFMTLCIALSFCVSCAQSINVDDGSDPVKPTGLVATRGDTEVTLDWNVASGAESYTVYWKVGTSVTPDDPLKHAGIGGTTDTVTGLVNGTTYAFIVVSVAGGSASAPSAIVTKIP